MSQRAPHSQHQSHSDAFQAMNAEHLVEKTWEMFKVMAFWFSVLLVSVSILGESVEELTLFLFSLSVFLSWGFYQKRWYVFARYILFLNVFFGAAFISLQFGPESYAYFLYLPMVLAILSSFGSNYAGYGISSLFLASACYLKYTDLRPSFIQPVESPEEFRFLFILITMGICYRMTTRFLEKNREFRLRLKAMLNELQENEAHLQENCRLEGIQVKQFEIANERLAQEIQNRIKAERQFSSSNEQLAQFSYAASHDLKEPLRSISGFIQLIQRKVSNVNNPVLEEHTGEIIKSSLKMTALLDDLLAYSKACKMECERTVIDLNKLVFSLRYSVKALQKVDITVAELPEVIANSLAIEQVFEKILLNAVQNSHPERPLSISISSNEIDDETISICIADNGRGIDPSDREKVFELFYRGESTVETTRSGVGLSICKKIIQSFGCDIWFESNDTGEGVACVFTLPASGEKEVINSTDFSRIKHEI